MPYGLNWSMSSSAPTSTTYLTARQLRMTAAATATRLTHFIQKVYS